MYVSAWIGVVIEKGTTNDKRIENSTIAGIFTRIVASSNTLTHYSNDLHY